MKIYCTPRMKQKLQIPDFADRLAQGQGISKKSAESFLRSFFQVLEKGLTTDKLVKIKGLGTFKLVTVSERESININTGERFQIIGHTKVSFTPDTAMKEKINRPFAHFESVDLSDDTTTEELDAVAGPMEPEEDEMGPEEALMEAETDFQNYAAAPAVDAAAPAVDAAAPAVDAAAPAVDTAAPAVDAAAPASSSTPPTANALPEAEVPIRLEIEADGAPVVAEQAATDSLPPAPEPMPAIDVKRAQTAAQEAVSVAADEKRTVAKLLPVAESAPAASPQGAREEPVAPSRPQMPVTPAVTPQNAPSPLSQSPGTQSTQSAEEATEEEPCVQCPFLGTWGVRLFLLVFFLLSVFTSYMLGYYRVLCPETSPSAATVSVVETAAVAKVTATPASQEKLSAEADSTAAKQDTAAVAHSADSVAASKARSVPVQSGKVAPAPKPTVQYHTIVKGDNLTRISRKYYGSDKYVRFIIKTNQLRDADNIFVGLKLTLPPATPQDATP